LIVDGATVSDPASETYFGYGKQASGIEVPEAGVDFYLPKNVPHGDVRERWYQSKITIIPGSDVRNRCVPKPSPSECGGSLRAGAEHALVSPAGGQMGRGAPRRKRTPRRDDLRRRGKSTAATE
jgi:hypothetical protein